MENSYSRLSKSQTVTRHASTHDIKSSLKDIQKEYAKAIEQIQDLKSEKAHLRATLNHSLEERANKSNRDDSGFVEQFSQSLKSTFAKKAVLDAEKRVLELEEENSQLRKLIRRNGKKFVKLQEEILAYQYQADKLGHLKLYNKNLQSEMELLDQEFQNIVKRVDYLDDEKSQSQINQSLYIKNTKDFRDGLTKYINYIVKTVSSLDPKNFIRFHFEENFPSGSSLVNLVENREYSTLLMKSLKFIIELMPNNPNITNVVDHDTSLQGLSPFSVGEMTPQKASPFHTINDPIWSQMAELNSQNSQLLQTSITKGALNNSTNREITSSRIRSQTTKPLINLQQDQNQTQGQGPNGSIRKQRETQSSLSFGTRESKGQSMAMESPRSVRSQNELVQRLDIFPSERPTYGFPEVRTPTVGGSACGKDDFESKTAAELELIHRERELIEREKELMEKKKEYLMRSRELNDSVSEQRSYREKDGRSLNESASEHGRIRSQKRIPTEIDEIKEEDIDLGRNPLRLKSILKSSSSQMIVEPEKEIGKRRKEEENLSVASAGMNQRSAKDISSVLREKSKHLAKVLNKEASYADDLHSISKSEHDISIQKDATLNRSREKSPVSSCKNFDDEAPEQLKLNLNKGKSSDKILHEDYESHFGSNETSFATDKKSWFYPKSLNNQSKNNSNVMGSYYPISMENPNRRESNESRRDETSNKKVSFYGQNQRTLEDQDSIKSLHYSQQIAQTPGQDQYQEQFEEQENENSNENENDNVPEQDKQQAVTFNPIRRFSEHNNRKGTQYASFTVSFGRTESAERDPTSPVKYLTSIMDVSAKKRVDHLHQTYDVVKGEELYKRAVRENGSPQYKHNSDSQPSSRRARKYFNSEDYMALQTKSMVQQKDCC